MPPARKRTPPIYKKLAMAETVLILALVADTLVNQWLFSRPEMTPVLMTLVRMGFIVGLFGPVFEFLSKAIDHALDATRSVTDVAPVLGRAGAHVMLMGGIFIAYYYSMHHTLPWKNHGIVAGAPADIDEPTLRPPWSSRSR
jgi:hypothetical protein